MTTPDVRSWLAARFRERREWWQSDLWNVAREAGITLKDFWDESTKLPILKRFKFDEGGDRRWTWVAPDGWPSEEAAS